MGMVRKVSDGRPVASSHGSSVYHHGVRLVAIVAVALLCCYAVTWGMCYVRMAHLERDLNNALSERMMVGGSGIHDEEPACIMPRC